MRRLPRIALREYLSYLKTPGFWISLLIGPLIGALAAVAPHIAAQAAPPPWLTVIDLDATQAGRLITQALRTPDPPARLAPPPPEVRAAGTLDEAERALTPYIAGDRLAPGGERLDVAVLLSGDAQQVRVALVSRNPVDPGLQGVVADAVGQSMQQARLRAAGLSPAVIAAFQSARPEVRSYSPRPSGGDGEVSLRDRLPSALGLGLAFLLFFAIFTGAGLLLNGVIEEKSTRVLEVLLSSASIPEILGGKILGAAALSATVICGWSAIGTLALAHYWPALLGDVAGALFGRGLAIWFALYFVLGYLMYAAVFAAIGAFCETVREAQTLLGPMMILVTLPVTFLTLASNRPDAPVVGLLSWFPPFTPFLMMARLSSGPPLWQTLGALVLMAVTTAAVVWLCAQAFRAGALSSGGLDLRRGVLKLLRRSRLDP